MFSVVGICAKIVNCLYWGFCPPWSLWELSEISSAGFKLDRVWCIMTFQSVISQFFIWPSPLLSSSDINPTLHVSLFEVMLTVTYIRTALSLSPNPWWLIHMLESVLTIIRPKSAVCITCLLEAIVTSQWHGYVHWSHNGMVVCPLWCSIVMLLSINLYLHYFFDNYYTNAFSYYFLLVILTVILYEQWKLQNHLCLV